MKMILGIVIGIVIWQFVLFVVQRCEIENVWWSVPIPYLFLLMFKGIISIIDFFKNLPLYLMMIKWGYNPFKTSVAELQSLTDEQKKQMIEKAHSKAKITLKKIFQI